MKNKIRIILISVFVLLAFSMLLTACANSGSDNNSSSEDSHKNTIEMPALEAEISITSSESVEEFETITLGAEVKNSKASVIWVSSDTNVAVVDQNGVVTALKAGSAIITATVEDASANCVLTVKKTTTAHLLSFDLGQASMYQGMTKSVNASVSYKEIVLDNARYGLRYTWTLSTGSPSDVVSMETVNNGATANFTALKAGEVFYDVVTTARGYEIRNTIKVQVLENVVKVGFNNKEIVETETSFSTSITLGEQTNGTLPIGKIYPVLNGVPFETADVVISWASEDESAVEVVNGAIVAKKAGAFVLTGEGEYEGTGFSIILTVKVVKNNVQLNDAMVIETINPTIVLPSAINASGVEKITINSSNVVFDVSEEKGSIDGNIVTVALNNMPAKREELGAGKTLTVETTTTVYTMAVDVYTMIINDKTELDSWQAIAADNSVRAGLCVEEQKLAVLSGYFILGNNIEYDATWYPIIPYAGSASSINDLLNSPTLLQEIRAKYGENAVIQEDWTHGNRAGFQGVFDGQGYYVSGLKITGQYNAFIVTNGLQGIVRNISFIDVTLSAGGSVITAIGQGTIENIYIDVNAIEESPSVTTFIVRGQKGLGQAIIQNIIVDVRDCDNIQLLQKTQLIYDDRYTDINGVFVFGVTEETNGTFFVYDEKDIIKGFMTPQNLLDDEEYGEQVKTWDEEIWSFNDFVILPINLVDEYAGEIHFENSVSDININSSMMLKTDKDAKYIVYSLQQPNENISINGNILSVGRFATAGEFVTIIATSLIDGNTAQLTLEIIGELITETITTQFYIEQFNDNKAILKHTDFIVGEFWANQLNGEVYEVENAGELVVSLDSIALSTNNEKSIYNISVKRETKALNFTNVMAVTAVIRTVEDLRGFGAQGKYVDAGDSYIRGYYILGDDIDCQGAKFATSGSVFTGIFDGNGKAIIGIKVGHGGIFGQTSGATVKDVNFTGVEYVAEQYTALFASYSYLTTFANISVQVQTCNMLDPTANNCIYVTGLIYAYALSTTIQDVTVDAEGLDVKSISGFYCGGNTFTNFNVTLASYTVIGFIDWNGNWEQNEEEIITQANMPDDWSITITIA